MDKTTVNPQEPINAIRETVSKIKQDSQTKKTSASDLDLLESYECWQSILDHIQLKIQNNLAEKQDIIRVCRISYNQLNEMELCKKYCTQFIDLFKINYQEFYDTLVKEIFKHDENFESEAQILTTACEAFSNKIDKSLCLERVCLIYEKKIPNDRQLEQAYSKLLKIDAANHKALRYFKLLYTQNEQWEEVCKTLLVMIQTSKYPQIQFRSAHELAAIYLYQFDRPEKALEVIHEHCGSSHLDSTVIRFDAYQRLGDLNGCIRVLKETFNYTATDNEKAGLCYKIGSLELSMGQTESARDQFHQCIAYQSDFIDAHEQLLLLDLKNKKWNLVLQHLNNLQQSVILGENRERVVELKERLQQALSASGISYDS